MSDSHARVFTPVPSRSNVNLCSQKCKDRRVRAVYGWLSTMYQWWRGNARVEAACRVFDQRLESFYDGEHLRVKRCFACTQTDYYLPTVEQYCDARDTREHEARDVLLPPPNVRRLPVHRDSLGDFDESFAEHLKERGKGHLARNWGKR